MSKASPKRVAEKHVRKSAEDEDLKFLKSLAPKGWKIGKVEGDNIVYFEKDIHGELYYLQVMLFSGEISIDLWDKNLEYALDRDLPYVSVDESSLQKTKEKVQKIMLKAISQIKSPADKLEEVYEFVKNRDNAYLYSKGRDPHVWIGYRDDIAHYNHKQLRKLEDKVKKSYERKLQKFDFDIEVAVEAIIDHDFYREEEDPDYMGESRVQIEIRIK